ncbi:MAG: hypothetical protein ABF483_08645 [Liquorilactobacillus nagelii]|uniref:hypothetical protein n=1 Tax=Liquorilactobacillus nagelii TaxID=82688 RepID=UPI0006EFAB37|nr:hypothetical protein [Liquorilactobacillus nagelii]KRL40650.1 hypothetical protein FD45_GL001291 [Liquorilactobacillus nagelii DSM 13675]MCC7615514.1 hypothetical protein [Liquorilactobacillus nagelii]MCI1699377.1 hypothetical protein [Liquorilactobacillus nagelii]MCP9314614.1 hypothetical protein [Liquorilactobacillus nagelii]QYH53204.1 hypothetical protein G6O73_02415 [Liquorilactobacillus nagelii DSM 13675]
MKLSQFFRQHHGRHLEETPGEEKPIESNETVDETNYSRTAHLRQTKAEKVNASHQRLARRLNWIIFYLVVAIILVYCFMIFINF